MKLLRPTKFQVLQHLNIPVDAAGLIPPTHEESEWNNDHRQYVLHVLLPSVRPPLKTWKATVEAYLTDIQFEEDHPNVKIRGNPIKKGDIYSFEECLCDGSSVVPDIAYPYGKIKDPWGTAHDLIYLLHHLGWVDVFGHKWHIVETHDMYRDGWIAQGNSIVGWTWWTGLMLGGWTVWNRGLNEIEGVSSWTYKDNTKCEPFAIEAKTCC